eukprot:4434858-Alexandrium_andersonii.AAC.1
MMRRCAFRRARQVMLPLASSARPNIQPCALCSDAFEKVDGLCRPWRRGRKIAVAGSGPWAGVASRLVNSKARSIPSAWTSPLLLAVGLGLGWQAGLSTARPFRLSGLLRCLLALGLQAGLSIGWHVGVLRA